MRDSRTLFCSFKITMVTRAEKLWPILLQSVVTLTGILYINTRNMHFSQIVCLCVSYDDKNKQYNNDQKIEVFWDVTLCQFNSSYQCFWAESSSAASVTVYCSDAGESRRRKPTTFRRRRKLEIKKTVYNLTRLHFPEDFNWNIHQHHCENPTSRIVNYLVFVMKTHFVFCEQTY